MVVTSRTALQYVRAVAKAMTIAGPAAGGTVYRGKTGARRLARETGYGLNDFPPSQHERAIEATYEELLVPFYGKGYIPKREWVREVKSQIGR